MTDLRECLPPPIESHLSSPANERRISFRHPAYPDAAPDLLCLSAVDGGLGVGIEYNTALVACGIVAGNRWDGAWFSVRSSSDNDSIVPVEHPSDGILRDSVYYFCVGSSSEEPYPTCRVTGYFEARKVAHLVPISAAGWFESNRMKQYCRLPSKMNIIDNDRNMFLLRRDLHQLFDTRRFTIMPKTSIGAAAPTLITHVLLPQTHPELHILYHNRALQEPLTGIAVEMLFARFI
ncbi:hypothetical protein QBC46DRAFT_411015 [Diplogelasinospora grovesii]|uniref:HNH nuclease domain-containing protein n=1 Tax=Diplogelasinospora grovesii TaxID=303347 RepID=A0AAN6S2H6_9PEZI|nr:hypothetical protein QBC46DRAFT_411015 [Diplogelasinospora grovesii]